MMSQSQTVGDSVPVAKAPDEYDQVDFYITPVLLNYYKTALDTTQTFNGESKVVLFVNRWSTKQVSHRRIRTEGGVGGQKNHHFQAVFRLI